MRILIDISDETYNDVRVNNNSGWLTTKSVEDMANGVFNGMVITKDQCDMEYNTGYCNGYYDALEDAVLRLQCMKKSNYNSYADCYNQSPFKENKE